MAPNRIEKKWVVKQMRRAASLKTLQALQKFVETFTEAVEEKTSTNQHRYLTAANITFDETIEIFNLKDPVKPWELHAEIHDTPKSLTFNLGQLKKAFYETNSEAYSRIAIDYLIVASMVKHRNILSKLPTHSSEFPANDPTTVTSSIHKQCELSTDSPYDQAATVVPILGQTTNIAGPAPSTPLLAPKGTFRPLPIKVFPEMALSVQVKRGNQEWYISGIVDWAMGYGNRAALEDGTVLLAVEAKRINQFSDAEAQLLAYLATIRQLRIQANKENVMTQGFYSDGKNYRFLCIRNNGTVMRSMSYDISFHERHLKSVFNFLLGMLITATESSPKTSPAKRGPEQDKRIENFDQNVFVEVFKDAGEYNISSPETYSDEEDGDIELPDIIIKEE